MRTGIFFCRRRSYSPFAVQWWMHLPFHRFLDGSRQLLPVDTSWEPWTFSLNKLAKSPAFLNRSRVLRLECLPLVNIKLVLHNGAAPTFPISLTFLEVLLQSLSKLVEDIERHETVASTRDTLDDGIPSPGSCVFQK